MNPPTKRESRLSYCEQVIALGKQTFLEVGNALAEIMEDGLYKEKGFGSFAEYCEKVWGFKKSYAYQLVDAAALIKQSPEFSTMVENPRQARELARVPAEKRAEVLAAAGEKPTAKSIRQAARVPLSQASEPTSRGETISGGEMVHNEPAAVSSSVSSSAATTGTNLTHTAEKVIEEADVLIENMKYAIEQIKSGTIDCKSIKDLIAENSKMSRWLMALAAEIC
jgi:hypothetical protein